MANFTPEQRQQRQELYKQALASPHWKSLRLRALTAAGNRCTHVGDDPSSPPQARCGTRGPGLHLHHLNYERLGHELLTDIKVLCPAHHAAYELMKCLCDACGDPVFAHVEDALDHWVVYHDVRYRWADNLACAREEVPLLCVHCDRMFEDD